MTTSWGRGGVTVERGKRIGWMFRFVMGAAYGGGSDEDGGSAVAGWI